MSTALKLQKNLLKQITKDWENFGKRSKKERTKNYISSRIAVLEENFKTSTQHNADGISAIEAGKEDELEETFDKIKDTYLDYKTALLDSMDKLQATAETPVRAMISTCSDKNVVRLPKINLPVFTGEYESWKSFHDLFVSLIHTNKALSELKNYTI